MKKYYFSYIALLLSILILSISCKKTANKGTAEVVLKITSSNSVDFLSSTGFSDDCVRVFTELLDAPKIQKLADDIGENKRLISFLEKNRNSIKTWHFLSSSKLSKDIKIINYFDNLPEDKFTLKTVNNVSSIFDKKSGLLIATVDIDRIIIKITRNFNEIKDFLNFHKLIPSTTYQVNDLLYKTDEFSRITSVKKNLIKLSNFTPKAIEEGYYISEKFGGSILDINKTYNSQNLFKEIEESWINALKKHEKISNLNISPIYVDNTNIPASYNVLYFKGKERIYKNIPNTLSGDLLTLKNLSLKSGINVNDYFDNIFLKKNLDKIELDFNNLNFISTITKNPQLLNGYKEIIELPSNHRYNTNVLTQATNWVKGAKKTRLIIDLPNNINKNLINQISAYGIKYSEKIIPYKNINFRGVFPDFSNHSIFSTILPIEIHEKNNLQVFEYCTKQLKLAYDKNPNKVTSLLKKYNKKMVSEGTRNVLRGKYLNEKEILAQQIKDITKPSGTKGRIFGFTWHHNENIGKMELVEDGIHDLNKHTGGNKIWGASIAE